MRSAFDVAVGVISMGADVLLSRRQQHQDHGGLWEFPGGKLDHGESPQHALARECQEELGIVIDSFQPLLQVWHDYRSYSVLLHVFMVSRFCGQPQGREGQQVRWVSRSCLSEYHFPAANEAIVASLCF